MEKVLIKPREGLRVKNPKTMQPLPAEGTRVVLSTYWKRRLNAADIVVVVVVADAGEAVKLTNNIEENEND